MISLTAPAAAEAPFAYRLMLTDPDGPEDGEVVRRHTAELAICHAPAITNYQIEACLTAELARQEHSGVAALTHALTQMAPERRRMLRAAEHWWERARAPFCRREEARYAAAPIAPLVYVSCQIELVIRRTIWLERLRS